MMTRTDLITDDTAWHVRVLVGASHDARVFRRYVVNPDTAEELDGEAITYKVIDLDGATYILHDGCELLTVAREMRDLLSKRYGIGHARWDEALIRASFE